MQQNKKDTKLGMITLWVIVLAFVIGIGWITLGNAFASKAHDSSAPAQQSASQFSSPTQWVNGLNDHQVPQDSQFSSPSRWVDELNAHRTPWM